MGVATGVFQTVDGTPVANGRYQWKLSSDAINVGSACCSPRLISGYLDANGSMSATFTFNDQLVTAGGTSTTYQLTVKDSGGGQVWNENYFLSGAAANLNAIVPLGIGVGGGLGVSLSDSVQTINSSQTIGFAGALNTFIKATAGASGIALALPPALAFPGQVIKVVMMDTGPGAVTMTGSLALRTNYVLSNQGQFVQLESDASNFTVVGGN
jgi:hypothetical protein